jgi:uncharacterized protein YgiM (DUF1202 family)
MSVEKNETLQVLSQKNNDGWTLVKRLNGERGYVPTGYISITYHS